jgi:hypothetical protein
VRGIRREDRIGLHPGKGTIHVQFDRLDAPPAYSGQVFGDVACLPGEMGQFGREVRRVLAGARADFQHRAAIAEDALQDREDRPAVARAGFGERL